MSNTPDLPPPVANVPPTAVPTIVDSLEPELAAAYRAGHPAVMQAVAAGATTTQMVVNDMIRQGMTTGMPPGVQQLIDQRKKELDDQSAAENERLRKLAAGVAGLGLMAASIPAEAGDAATSIVSQGVV